MTMWREDLDSNTTPFRFFLFVSRPYRVQMIIALSAAALGALLSTSTSYVFKLIVNAATNFVVSGSGNDLWNAVLVYVALTVAAQISWRISGFVGMRWSTGVRATSRYALSSYITLHSHQYFSNRFAGSLLSKIANAATSIKSLTDQLMWSFTYSLVSLITSFCFIFAANHTLALIFLGWVGLVAPLNIYLARHRVPLSAAAQNSETVLGGATVDMLTNMSAVEEYASRTFELERLKSFIINRRSTGLRNWIYGEWILVLNGVLQTVFIGGLLITSTILLTAGKISPGDIALVLTVVIIAEDILRLIGQELNNFADNWGQISESLDEILISHDVVDTNVAEAFSALPALVELKNATFNYDGIVVFNNLSLVIPPGQKVGLVGRSGAGKSTLVKLILRHYDLQGGQILIGDVDIAKVSKNSLRDHIAVVPQEPMLFHRTLRENIAYGKHDATEAEIIAAATQAEAHEFIMQLPQGYDSLVGERGVKLSGGQRQRVAIARAMLKNAPLLLLDEATSALDSESEVAVQKALLNLMHNRTVIAIAHRLSTLRAMDRIIVMEQGNIIEDGTHEELLERSGLYASLWSHQAKGFLEE
jgi:ATP-binding cassette, subfamily B, bacterial